MTYCGACGSTDIFYRGLSRYGAVDLCYTHAEARCSPIEERNTRRFVDHVNDAYKIGMEKETGYTNTKE